MNDARTPTYVSVYWPLAGPLFLSFSCLALLWFFPSIRGFAVSPLDAPERSMLGAPNGRVTRDAPLAWPGLAWLGRARLLGAQMMYAGHSLSLFLPRSLARFGFVAFAFLALFFTYSRVGMPCEVERPGAFRGERDGALLFTNASTCDTSPLNPAAYYSLALTYLTYAVRATREHKRERKGRQRSRSAAKSLVGPSFCWTALL